MSSQVFHCKRRTALFDKKKLKKVENIKIFLIKSVNSCFCMHVCLFKLSTVSAVRRFLMLNVEKIEKYVRKKIYF